MVTWNSVCAITPFIYQKLYLCSDCHTICVFRSFLFFIRALFRLCIDFTTQLFNPSGGIVNDHNAKGVLGGNKMYVVGLAAP